ncbi:uncharacterized protein PV09_02205 [Verruconis gallopava]|uniref:GA4 desaturase n=1 Tax=Verruconis gallopava TaxID=253628 RepID=A0A0D2B801_9PEZI|nr:uncharacterized protein PV09_02205 [Verruconis gallopava]KIW07359.1 hypothetical protein PV09_02205 [Verruconis gallopava]
MATSTVLAAEPACLSVLEHQQNVPSHGRLRYITRGLIPTASPHLYHLPPLSEFGDIRLLPIRDIKESLKLGDENPYTLDSHGFTARRHPSVLHSFPYSRLSWNDETLLKSVYIPEVEDLLRNLTGANKVVTEMVLIRSEIHSEIDALASSEEIRETDRTGDDDSWPKMIGISAGAGASPAPKVHLDFSPAGARVHLRKYHGALAKAGAEVISKEDNIVANGVRAEDLHKWYDGPRWAMFSIWRPLKRVTRDPLAFADRRSFPRTDYVPVDLVEPTGKALRHMYPAEMKSHKAETLLAYGSDNHEWCWVWDMEPEEVVVIQLFDSEAEKRGYCGVMHSSVDVPETEHEPARESIEVRCTAFW